MGNIIHTHDDFRLFRSLFAVCSSFRGTALVPEYLIDRRVVLQSNYTLLFPGYRVKKK